MMGSPAEKPGSRLVLRVLMTLGYVALTPLAFYVAVMTAFPER